MEHQHGQGVRESQGEASTSSLHYNTAIPETVEAHQPQLRFLRDQLSLLDDDAWSCIIAIITFWIFVTFTLILGVYGPENFRVGPFSSILIQTNSLFVQSLKVEGSAGNVNPGLKLYGMRKSPMLNVEKTWSSTRNSSLPYKSYKEWVYYLNSGSHINITYNLYPKSSPLVLAIAGGYEEFSQWLEDPTYPNTTLYWNVAHGDGFIHQNIYESSMYYITSWNSNLRNVEMQLNVTVLSLMYYTREAYYECIIGNDECTVDVSLPWSSYFVLSSQESSSGEDWFVKVSYEPRLITYIVGVVGMTIMMFAVITYLNKNRVNQIEPERAPLLRPKDDLSSCCSSYGSFSSDEKEFEDLMANNFTERDPLKLEQVQELPPTCRLCAICFDAPRDCFFLPCGHSVSCFACASRILDASAVCPVCRRIIKKVRKIFTV